MNPFIRSATLNDAARLASLHRGCFREAWDEATFVTLLQRPGCFAMLAGESETDSQAFILVQLAGREAEIQSLGTLAPARRKGFAGALVHAATRACQERHITEIFLEAAADNAAALSLYTRAQFNPVGRRRGYYPRVHAPPVDAVILRKLL
jgi:[ribosomal protein S18]-alanine N-acetyltransferase